jgi:hypothetical protein
VEVSEDVETTPDAPRFDGVKIRLRAADGTTLKVDAALQIEQVWKIQSRLEDDSTIALPDVN